VNTFETGHQMDVAAAGTDGFVGLGGILQMHPSPYWYIVQLDSNGYRIDSDAFEKAFSTRSTVRSTVLVYVGRAILHAERAEMCQRFYLHNHRVAYWLLLLCHRSRQQSMPLTHDMIARRLGTPRHAVTHSLAELRDRRAITYSRGRVEIIDEELLRLCACECAAAKPK
jgi:CRP-like cAMP-binding protein